MATEQPLLFRDKTTLSDYFDGATKSAVRSVMDAGPDDAAVQAAGARALESWRLYPVTLQRKRATWTHADTPMGHQMRLTVPFNGSNELLRHAPDNLEPRVQETLRGEVNRDHSVDVVVRDEQVFFVKVFPGETSEEQVRTWGGQVVDLVEKVVALATREAEQLNAELDRAVTAAMHSRRRTLSASGGLKDMGTGV